MSASLRTAVLTATVLTATVLTGVVGAAVLAVAPAEAQSQCTQRRLSNPTRIAYDCGGGIVIEREAATRMGLPTDDIAGAVPTVNLTRGAALYEVEGGAFQVRTPHAIASVRGTVFIVDVTGQGTAVFVQEGSVRVTGAGSTVTLGPGDGVDVPPVAATPPRRESGRIVTAPLQVTRWGARRADALLARFGR